MDILGKSGLGLELAKQVAVVKVPGVLPFDGIGAAALAYLDQKKRAEAAETEVERLKGVLGKIADGDVPREAVTIWRSDGIHSKHDKCGHERVMYDDCDNCTSEFARSALEAKP